MLNVGSVVWFLFMLNVGSVVWFLFMVNVGFCSLLLSPPGYVYYFFLMLSLVVMVNALV